MRVIVNANAFVIALILVIPAAGCSDDVDPIDDKCATACKVESTMPPACANIEQRCVADCTKLSRDADRDPQYISGCGECVAESFKYAYKTDPPCDKNPADPACWCDTQHLAPGDPECLARCFEPDGGIGY